MSKHHTRCTVGYNTVIPLLQLCPVRAAPSTATKSCSDFTGAWPPQAIRAMSCQALLRQPAVKVVQVTMPNHSIISQQGYTILAVDIMSLHKHKTIVTYSILLCVIPIVKKFPVQENCLHYQYSCHNYTFRLTTSHQAIK